MTKTDIVRFDGTKVESQEHLKELMNKCPIGVTVEAVIMRDGQEVVVPFKKMSDEETQDKLNPDLIQSIAKYALESPQQCVDVIHVIVQVFALKTGKQISREDLRRISVLLIDTIEKNMQ